ncbi:hypothetical protein GCM10023210_06980 [Chryseobacterium ginsengisoli]|uniref:YcxB-like protein domain-containing protein n=1 Tax=Chryseobacterium ginsengisoli TaxID=363853 RepID=A0ABP9M094_9FLAO
MRSLKNLDIEKSIESKKLVYEESWSDKFDAVGRYFIFSILIFYSFLVFKEIKPSPNNSLDYFVLSSLLTFCLYSSYCKFTEKNLKEIKFYIHKEEAKRRILEYGKKYKYRISKISSNLIFFNEPINGFSGWGEEKTTVIFFQDQSIFYTVIQNGRKTNAPVLISQHFIRKDFKKILNQKKFDLNPKKSYFDRFFNDPIN